MIIIKKTLLIVLTGFAVFGVLVKVGAAQKEHIEKSVIRFHVIANSDSYDDQELKLKVRDAVIEFLKPQLEKSDNPKESKDIICSLLNETADAAKDCIVKNGYSYNASASVGNFHFPTKSYGDTDFPAGNYDALRIVIGDGGGENWWCVLYPQLCFVSSSSTALPEESKEKLKSILSEDEYKIITSKNSKDLPAKIKFKLLEWLF